MICRCNEIDHVVRGDDANLPCDTLEEEAWDPKRWNKLYHCTVCEQYWQVDVWDKYQVGLAIKIAEKLHWNDFEDDPIRFQFMIDSHNGLSSKECCWKDCKDKAMNALAFCPWHAYHKCGIRG